MVLLGCGFVVSLLVAIIFYTQIKQAEDGQAKAETELREYVNKGQDGPALAGWVANARESGSISAFRAMANELDDQAAVIASRDRKITELEAVRDEANRGIESAQQAVADRDAQLARQQAQMQGAMQELQDRARQVEAQLSQLSAERDTLSKTLQDTMLDANASAQHQIDGLNDQLGTIENEMAELLLAMDEQAGYVAYLEELNRDKIELPEVASPDGEVLSVFNSGSQLFINRGRRQGILLGMTFEVFEASDVIRLSDAGAVRGKATVEVYDIQDDTATCRVVRGGRGGQITPGDHVANLVYDPDKVFAFFVYGDFDIEYDGGDSDLGRIQALITDWGGELVRLQADEDGLTILSPEVDFVVLGAQPEFPEEPDDSNFDPEVIQAWQAKVREYEIYQALLDDAQKLRIPVLNQNRFMDLVGYYVR